MGEALSYGRALHKADRDFSKWIKEQGFDDIDRRVRADAMWLAQNWSQVSGDQTPLATPGEIRRAFNEAQADLPPTPELAIKSPDRLTANIEQVAPQAKTINKLASMAGTAATGCGSPLTGHIHAYGSAEPHRGEGEHEVMRLGG